MFPRLNYYLNIWLISTNDDFRILINMPGLIQYDASRNHFYPIFIQATMCKKYKSEPKSKPAQVIFLGSSKSNHLTYQHIPKRWYLVWRALVQLALSQLHIIHGFIPNRAYHNGIMPGIKHNGPRGLKSIRIKFRSICLLGSRQQSISYNDKVHRPVAKIHSFIS